MASAQASIVPDDNRDFYYLEEAGQVLGLKSGTVAEKIKKYGLPVQRVKAKYSYRYTILPETLQKLIELKQAEIEKRKTMELFCRKEELAGNKYHGVGKDVPDGSKWKSITLSDQFLRQPIVKAGG